MAYEYEDKVVNILKTFGVLYNSNINFIMAEEVREAYAKAKAWDNYLADVENSVREVTGNEVEGRKGSNRNVFGCS